MKDPAFLFYSSDFLTGVANLTMEERGQYITLMCLQHQLGHLTEKTIRLSLGSVSDDVLKKFITDEDGLLYNKRLETEIDKRTEFVESRRQNGQKGGRPKKPSAKPYGKAKKNLAENDNDNENEDISIYEFIEEELGITISSSAYEKISDWLKEYSEDLIRYAIKQSVYNNVRTFNYANGVLTNLKGEGITNVSQIKPVKKQDEELNKETVDILNDYNWLEDNDV